MRYMRDRRVFDQQTRCYDGLRTAIYPLTALLKVIFYFTLRGHKIVAYFPTFFGDSAQADALIENTPVSDRKLFRKLYQLGLVKFLPGENFVAHLKYRTKKTHGFLITSADVFYADSLPIYGQNTDASDTDFPICKPVKIDRLLHAVVVMFTNYDKQLVVTPEQLNFGRAQYVIEKEVPADIYKKMTETEQLTFLQQKSILNEVAQMLGGDYPKNHGDVDIFQLIIKIENVNDIAKVQTNAGMLTRYYGRGAYKHIISHLDDENEHEFSENESDHSESNWFGGFNLNEGEVRRAGSFWDQANVSDEGESNSSFERPLFSKENAICVEQNSASWSEIVEETSNESRSSEDEKNMLFNLAHSVESEEYVCSDESSSSGKDSQQDSEYIDDFKSVRSSNSNWSENTSFEDDEERWSTNSSDVSFYSKNEKYEQREIESIYSFFGRKLERQTKFSQFEGDLKEYLESSTDEKIDYDSSEAPNLQSRDEFGRIPKTRRSWAKEFQSSSADVKDLKRSGFRPDDLKSSVRDSVLDEKPLQPQFNARNFGFGFCEKMKREMRRDGQISPNCASSRRFRMFFENDASEMDQNGFLLHDIAENGFLNAKLRDSGRPLSIQCEGDGVIRKWNESFDKSLVESSIHLISCVHCKSGGEKSKEPAVDGTYSVSSTKKKNVENQAADDLGPDLIQFDN